MITPKSNLYGFKWPAVPGTQSVLLMALQYQFEHNQWLSAGELRELQFGQFDLLLRHAGATVPFYRERLRGAFSDSQKSKNPIQQIKNIWSQIPLLSRTDLAERHDDLLSTNIPKQHGKVSEKETSGSSGTRLKISDSAANGLFWQAITLREHMWHQRQFSETFVGIRSGRYANNPSEVKESASWGPSTGSVFETGPSASFYNTMPVAEQAKNLQRLNPGYILGYPSNLQILGKYFTQQGIKLSRLRQILTYGEMLLPESRESCMEDWGVKIADIYSCEEVGYIAIQCPDSDHYHIQSEANFVEILNDDGDECEPGEVGRVVVTSLHNFAMPIIRYDIGDYAEVGEACACGRGLPVIKRILGRRRNRIRGLDGDRYWPNLNPNAWRDYHEVEELRLIQDTEDHVEIHILSRENLDQERENELGKTVTRILGQPFKFTVYYDRERQRPPSGKYQRFTSLV